MEIALGDHRYSTTGLDGIEDAARHVGGAQHGGTTAAENAGLLPAYRLQRVAEPVAMIEPDGADDGHVAVHDVGGIQPAAETQSAPVRMHQQDP